MVVKPDFARYKAASQAIFALYRAVTPLVEPLSLDEAYLDVTENAWDEPLGMAVARRLKDQIRETTGLTASAGVAPNKFLARIASGWQKPDGLTVIAPERVESFLRELPVDALWGVGPVTAKKLRARGIDKLVDVRSADRDVLRETVGSLADWLHQLALGIDDRPVVSSHEAKSSGSERTFALDLTDIDQIQSEIEKMARGAAAWLARRALLARTVTIKVRYQDFTTIARSTARHQRAMPTRSPRERSRSSGAPRPPSALCACSASACTTSARPTRTRSAKGARTPRHCRSNRCIRV